MIILQITFDTFGAQFTLIDWKIVPGFKPDHTFVMDFELDTALHTTETAVGFDQPIWLSVCLPTIWRFIIQMRSKLVNQFGFRQWKRGHMMRPSLLLRSSASRLSNLLARRYCVVRVYDSVAVIHCRALIQRQEAAPTRRTDILVMSNCPIKLILKIELTQHLLEVIDLHL